MEQEIKKPGAIKRLIFTGQLTRLTVYLIAAVPAFIFIIMAVLIQIGVLGPLKLGFITIGTPVDFILFALFLGTGIFGFYEYETCRNDFYKGDYACRYWKLWRTD